MAGKLHIQCRGSALGRCGRCVLVKFFEPLDEMLPEPSSLEDSLSQSKAKGKTEAREQIENLFNDQETSDIEIVCGGEVFYCHQAILMKRSDVFRGLFKAKMQETITRKVPIKDVSPDVIKGLLQFIYTGATDEDILKEKPGELLAAAEKYMMNSLKEVCELQLCLTLQVDNSVESLVLGDMYRAPRLRRMALQMVARKLAKVSNTYEERYLCKNHPNLATEISLAMIERED